jgi:hypothetical protein
MKRFGYLLIIVPLLLSLSANAKNNTAYVDVLKIVNKDLPTILDSIVDHETRCDYYKSDLLFVILMRGEDIIIGTIGEKIKKGKNILGCFSHKNHLFFVEGTSLDETLFERTNQRKKYTFSVSKSGTDPKTGVFFIDSMDIQDDSYSYWEYFYAKNDFIFHSRSTYCD